MDARNLAAAYTVDQRHPADGPALLERGRLALETGQPAEAEGLLRRAAAARPHDRDTNYHLALCLQGLGKADEAATYLSRMRAIEDDLKRLMKVHAETLKRPDDPGLRLEAALICLRNGDEAEGLRWLHGALLSDPRHRPTHQALADYYERHGDATRAGQHRRLAGAALPALPGAGE